MSALSVFIIFFLCLIIAIPISIGLGIVSVLPGIFDSSSCSRSRASGNPDRRYGMRDMLSDSVCRYARTCCRPYWEC